MLETAIVSSATMCLYDGVVPACGDQKTLLTLRNVYHAMDADVIDGHVLDIFVICFGLFASRQLGG